MSIFSLTNLKKTVMNKSFKIPIVLTIFLALLFSSCKKDNPIKPKGPEDYRVSYDKLTFGAYVNGEPWIPDYYDVGNGVGPIDFIFLGNGSNTVKLKVVAQKNSEHLNIFVPADLSIGRFEFNTNGGTHPTLSNPPAYGLFQKYYPSKEYKTNTQYTGFINITKYNRYYPQFEATFEFTAVNPSTGDTIKVTNGYLRKD
jgi:hypothetical protein